MLNRIKRWLFQNTKYGKTRYLNYLYRYDLEQYYANSCMNTENFECTASRIRILSHAIEKGLSLPHCKPGFGKEKILELIKLNEEYSKHTICADKQVSELVFATVSAYVKFQREHNINLDFIPEKYLNASSNIKAGTATHISGRTTDFEAIAKSRHSSRNFADTPIENDVIEKIVALAQSAPSACNRQSTHVYACVNKEKIQAIMEMHNGVRGFGQPAVVFAVAGNLNLYLNEYERNIVFVDGGIFVMNLLYSIDSLGLASCPVIWGSEPDNDKKLADLLGIPNNHKVVALVMAGYYPEDTYTAALSPKRETHDILHIIK